MRGRILLVGSMLTAIVVATLTTVVLLLVAPGLSKAEAIKTGGLAGGAVLALYALWLNDRPVAPLGHLVDDLVGDLG